MGKYYNYNQNDDAKNVVLSKIKSIFSIPLIIGVVILIIIANSCTTIDSGSVGLKFYKWSSDSDKR
ncbi:MAG: hypothetical protein J6U08_03365, partial [Paludibacteraceae bacterium]|nr:hypothetical protein [Paludibacteraceae bacterium]